METTIKTTTVLDKRTNDFGQTSLTLVSGGAAFKGAMLGGDTSYVSVRGDHSQIVIGDDVTLALQSMRSEEKTSKNGGTFTVWK